MHPMILIMSVLVAAVGAAQPTVTTNRCDAIPLGRIDFQDMIRLSPFIMYRSTEGAFNCSTIGYVGPAGTHHDYNGTSILTSGRSVITHDVTMKDNSVFATRQCSEDSFVDYRVLFSNLNTPSNASFCAFMCDNQGVSISMVACVGRTPQDEAYIQNYLDTQIKVPITVPVYHSQSDCPKPKSCFAFR